MASSKQDDFEMGSEELPHVLVVDDCFIERKLVEQLLKKSSLRVTTAENGLRALEYLGIGDGNSAIENKERKVNMIITDYCMPGMTGYELLKKIKESSTMKEIPVIVVSSENVPTRINKCLQAGAEEFILKPIQQSDVKKLRCYLRGFNERPSNSFGF